MTQPQKDFLNDLAALLKKYSIDKVDTAGKMIVFQSNDDILSFSDYDGDVFNAVTSAVTEYQPET